MSITLPSDIFTELLLKADLGTISKLCQTNREIFHICNNEIFWQKKTEQDYSIDSKPNDISWMQIYLISKHGKFVSIFINDKFSRNLLIKLNQSFEILLTKLFENIENPKNYNFLKIY